MQPLLCGVGPNFMPFRIKVSFEFRSFFFVFLLNLHRMTWMSVFVCICIVFCDKCVHKVSVLRVAGELMAHNTKTTKREKKTSFNDC